MYKLKTNAGLSRLIGAGTPALLFENDRFHFEFLHQPVLLNATGDDTKAPYTQLGFTCYGSNPVKFYSRYGGLYLVDLGVTSGDTNLWTNVGFTQSSFVNDNCSNIGDNSTTAYINQSAFQNKTYAIPLGTGTGTVFNYEVSSEISTELEAETEYQYDVAGYYLINVVSAFNK